MDRCLGLDIHDSFKPPSSDATVYTQVGVNLILYSKILILERLHDFSFSCQEKGY